MKKTRPTAFFLRAFAPLCLCALFCPPTIANDDYELQKARQELFRRAVATATPYVVQIDTIGGSQPSGRQAPKAVDADGDGKPDEQPVNPFQDTLGARFLVADGPTTGLIYRSDGLILASSFNFVRNPSYITVRLADGRQFVADLVARDRVRKLALLKIDATDLDTPKWVPTSDIKIGQWAIALGRGFGGDSPSVTVGIVSALNRMMGNAIQTDAKLSPANYGGPLIDIQGRVLGIAVPMAQRQGELAGVEFYDAGIGFALPEHRVREIVSVLEQGQSYDRGWLGVSVDSRSKDGLKIRAVGDPSPSHSMGIRADDIIIQANGHEIRNFRHLKQAIYMVPAGEAVQVIIRRGELEYGYEVTLARSGELGPLLPDQDPVVDPDNPFPIPPDSPWP